jgi:polar amino acid transport system substrate-binding protein
MKQEFLRLVMGKNGLRGPFFKGVGVFLLIVLSGSPLAAASNPPAAASFWDPGLRLERPDLSGVRAIRFLTGEDYPPLNFARADGSLAGFNVDIARRICEELEIGCTIQARGWDSLIESLVSGKGDAVIASIAAATSAVRGRVSFSQPYYQTPGRFIARKDSALNASATALAEKTIGVVSGSSHEVYLRAFFPSAHLKSYGDNSALQKALRGGDIDAAFADGLTFAVWLNGESSANCCAFLGGPYCESRFFGEGIGIAVRPEDVALRRALNWALERLFSRGVYEEIYLKYFPTSFY